MTPPKSSLTEWKGQLGELECILTENGTENSTEELEKILSSRIDQLLELSVLISKQDTIDDSTEQLDLPLLSMEDKTQEDDFHHFLHQNMQDIRNVVEQHDSAHPDTLLRYKLNLDSRLAALTSKPTDSMNWYPFHLGMRTGIVLIVFVWMLWDCIVDDSRHHNLWLSPVFHLYRGVGVLILLVWLWGCNVWIWKHFGIQPERLFQLDVCLNPVRIWTEASSLTILYLVNLLLYYKALRRNFHLHAYLPLVLYLYILLKFTLFCATHQAFGVSLKRVVLAPFAIVSFADAYLGDVLTSLIRVNVDLAWSTCYFVTGEFKTAQDQCSSSPAFKLFLVPLLHALPLWWRFCQNLRRYYDTHQRHPHLSNACKYACAQSVILFGILHPSYNSIWVICFCFATMYQFIWDVRMDWGFPRSQRIYNVSFIYYCAIAVNLVLRFLWTLSLIPDHASSPFGGHLQLYLNPIFAAAEVFRRCMWGCFRLENEQLVLDRLKARSIDPVDHVRPSSQRFALRVLIELACLALLVLLISLFAVS